VAPVTERSLWIGGILAVGICIGWYLHSAPVKEVVRWQTKIETRCQTVDHIVTKPGATVYIDREGNTTITGGVEITRSTSGQSSQTTTHEQTITPVDKSWLVGGGAGIGRDLVPQYGGMVGRRVLGPFWCVAQVYGPDPRGYLSVAVLW